MKKACVKDLTLEDFQKYGTFAQMLNPTTTKMGAEPIEFYRDMLQIDLGSCTKASFSICRVLKRPPVVDVTEYHSSCGEGILPLDGDVLIHVAVATPNGCVPLDQIEIFRVPRGTMVSLSPGVWHHAPIASGCDVANVVIVLPERTYANDCFVHEIPKGKQIKVKRI